MTLRLLLPLLLVLTACHPFEDTSDHPFDSADDAAALDTANADTVTADTRDAEDDSSGGDTIEGDVEDDGVEDDGVEDDSVEDDVEPSAICGDGQIEGDEACDDGASNGTVNTSCRADCTLPECGDGIVDVGNGELCDGADGCTEGCLWAIPEGCGDGQLGEGEGCDDGVANSDTRPDACRSHCQPASCGDAVVDLLAGEECDDGDSEGGDGCSSDCLVEARDSCGDGVIDVSLGEQCDDGDNQPGDGCNERCRLELVGQSCGDKELSLLEVCDDGNTTNGDGCNPTCNLTGQVSTPLLQDLNFGGGLTVDDQNLWLGFGTQIVRLDIATGCLRDVNQCDPEIVAGKEGISGYADADIGTSAVLGVVASMATDGRFLYFTDGHRVLRAMSTSPPYAVTTVAGQKGVCGNVEGIGDKATFRDIRALTWDAPSKRLYFLDSCYANVRSYDPATRRVTNVIGNTDLAHDLSCDQACNQNSGGLIEGDASVARMVSPRYMTSAQNGMLYITDTNGQALLSYNTNTGYLRLLAGGSGPGYVDGPADVAKLQRPRGLASDGTSLYWSEQTAHTVRQFTLTDEVASTLAGENGCSDTLDGTGGTGTFTQTCASVPPNDWARFSTPNSLIFHPGRGRLLVREANGLRVIQ